MKTAKTKMATMILRMEISSEEEKKESCSS
jgi:hypothetical protein